jgi:hypothetical protein
MRQRPSSIRKQNHTTFTFARLSSMWGAPPRCVLELDDNPYHTLEQGCHRPFACSGNPSNPLLIAMDLAPSEMLQYATVRLDVERLDGTRSFGTAFHFAFMIDGEFVPVLVTNKHVLDDAQNVRFALHAGDGEKPIVGSGLPCAIVDVQPGIIWHPAPDVDLAMIATGATVKLVRSMGAEVFVVHFAVEDLPTADEWQSEFAAVEEILMAGYPIGLADDVNNLPIIRRGITATHPSRDYNGKKEFMIDCACFPGSSGSPIILYNVGPRISRYGEVEMRKRMLLVGILWGGPVHLASGEVRAVPIPTSTADLQVVSRIPTNLGFVLKSDLLLDFLPILKRIVTKE